VTALVLALTVTAKVTKPLSVADVLPKLFLNFNTVEVAEST